MFSLYSLLSVLSGVSESCMEQCLKQQFIYDVVI